MFNRGYDHGYPIVKLVKRGYTVSNSGKNYITFEDLPSEDGGLPLACIGLIVRAPAAAITLTAAKVMDGASVAQILSLLTLELATGAPPSLFHNGGTLIDAVDGYTALQMLSYRSGCPVLLGSGEEFNIFGVPPTAADVTTAYNAVAAVTSHQRRGWLQYCGPFGSADASSGAWSDRVRFFLPIGLVAGEDIGAHAIPNTWLNGKAKGASSGPGKLTIEFGTKIDNIAMTITNGDTMDVWAVCIRQPRERMTAPTTMRLQRLATSDKQVKLRQGIRHFAGFMKPLTAAGAMQTHDYTRVAARVAGRDLIETDVDVNLDAQQAIHGFLFQGEYGDRFSFARSELAIGGNVAAGRYNRHCVPILTRAGSVLRAPGSVEEEILVDVQTTGETTHSIVDLTDSPITPEVAAALPAWAPIPGTTFVPSSKNGNMVPPHVAGLLPGRMVALPRR